MLEDKGGDLHAKTHKGKTLTDLAIENNQFELAKYLLFRGVELSNTQDNKGKYPIHHAAKSNDPALLKLLLESGMDINQQDSYGNSALHVSVLLQDLEMTKILLEYNLNTKLKNDQNESPQTLSAKRKQDVENLNTSGDQNKYDTAIEIYHLLNPST